MDSIKGKDPNQFVYLDEAGIDDNETYDYAWGPKGERVESLKFAKRNKRLSLISALNQGQLKAPFVFEGMCSRQVFETYVKEVLVHELQPGQIVILTPVMD